MDDSAEANIFVASGIRRDGAFRKLYFLPVKLTNAHMPAGRTTAAITDWLALALLQRGFTRRAYPHRHLRDNLLEL